MTVKECYEAMGGDYEDVLKRLMSEARVQKFALMFKKDPSMSQLTQAMDAGDVETAFRDVAGCAGMLRTCRECIEPA